MNPKPPNFVPIEDSIGKTASKASSDTDIEVENTRILLPNGKHGAEDASSSKL
jgi:hypothetical protein